MKNILTAMFTLSALLQVPGYINRAIAQTPAYLIVAVGHQPKQGMLGYFDNSIEVGDVTTMRPLPEPTREFRVPVTYVHTSM